MNLKETEIIVVEIIVEKLSISESDVLNGTNCNLTLKEIGADSLDQSEIFYQIEKHLQITFPDEMLSKKVGINSICRYIDSAENTSQMTNS